MALNAYESPVMQTQQTMQMHVASLVDEASVATDISIRRAGVVMETHPMETQAWRSAYAIIRAVCVRRRLTSKGFPA